MLNFRCYERYTDIKLVRESEEVQYEVDLTKFLSRLLDPVKTTDVGEVSIVGINKFVLRRPLEKLWLIDKEK